MCTALIYRNQKAGEFGIGFNRDESFLRKKATLPIQYQDNNIQILSPKDGDHHGTWIGVNNKSEVYALLNLYEVKIMSIAKPISRGLLVNELLCKKREIQDLNSNFLKDFLPFRLIYLTLEKTQIFTWDGKQVISESNSSEWSVYASSALHGAEAEKIRKQTFEKNFLQHSDSNFLEIAKNYLSCHIPEKGSLSPCMHRDVAHTVSQTIIHVYSQNACLNYKDGQPCEEPSFKNYQLALG